MTKNVGPCWVKDEALKRAMFKRKLTGQGGLGQKEARGVGKRGGMKKEMAEENK